MRVPAQVQFKSWFLENRRKGWTQARLAEKCGVDQSAVSRWLAGKGRPGEAHQALLELITGIPKSLWKTAKERKREEAALARASSTVAA
jgi:transcriptional regulator with XRE-family HTH domain